VDSGTFSECTGRAYRTVWEHARHNYGERRSWAEAFAGATAQQPKTEQWPPVQGALGTATAAESLAAYHELMARPHGPLTCGRAATVTSLPVAAAGCC
jgi:hypothetical protein